MISGCCCCNCWYLCRRRFHSSLRAKYRIKRFLWNFQRGFENRWLDFGGKLDPFPYFAPVFYPVIRFECFTTIRQGAALLLAEVCCLVVVVAGCNILMSSWWFTCMLYVPLCYVSLAVNQSMILCRWVVDRRCPISSIYHRLVYCDFGCLMFCRLSFKSASSAVAVT